MGFFKAVLDKLGPEAGELAFEGGYKGGSASTSAYKEKFGLSNEDIVDYMCSMGAELGWGKFEVEELSGDKLIVTVKNSPFVREDALVEGDANGSCHFIRGVLAGLGKTVLGGEVSAEETRCEGRGDEKCRFVIEKKDDG